MFNIDKSYILSELEKGNKDVLKGLPTSVIIGLGLTIQEEKGDSEKSPIDYDEVGKSMSFHHRDTGIKQDGLRKIEQEKQEQQKKIQEFKDSQDR